MMRNQGNKEKTQNLGWCPSDEKPKEQTIKLKQNLGWSPIDEIPNKQTVKLRQNLGRNERKKIRFNLGWSSIYEKLKQKRLSLDKIQDGILMM